MKTIADMERELAELKARNRAMESPAASAGPKPKAHDTYAAIPALNWSTLKHLAISAKELRWSVENPRVDTDALRLGRALHCAVLEPERFEVDYIAQPEPWPLNTNAGRRAKAEWLRSLDAVAFDERYAIMPEFGTSKSEKTAKEDWLASVAQTPWSYEMEAAWLEAIGKEAMDPAERESVERMRDALLKHRVAGSILRSVLTEQTVTWTDQETGLACKARLDMLTPLFVADLKTTRRHTRREMTNDFRGLLYRGQKAFYHEGATESRLLPPDGKRPYILAVQNEGPYDVVAGPISDLALEDGRRLCRRLLRQYALCQESGIWPGLADDEVEWAIEGYVLEDEPREVSDDF